MQVVREVKTVTGKQLTIDLPENFYAKEVEVIVIPYHDGVPLKDSAEWRQDFLAVSQWDITEEDVKLHSWTIKEF